MRCEVLGTLSTREAVLRSDHPVEPMVTVLELFQLDMECRGPLHSSILSSKVLIHQGLTSFASVALRRQLAQRAACVCGAVSYQLDLGIR
uniref:Uncharacterized protein n=1 Tax=Angiostrongylus cantonensis TaxID=6313 RepID=A0A0K0DI89_ANGCA